MNRETGETRAVRALQGTLLAALAWLALCGPARADKEDPYEPIGEGLTVGRFILHPTMVFEYTKDSNIYYIPSDLPNSEAISSGIIVVGPRFLADLPLDESRIRFLYAPFYRDYTRNGTGGFEHLNHLFDLDALFRSGHILTLRLRDHLTKGTISLSNVNGGNGLAYGLGNYYGHNPSLELGLDLGIRHGFSFIPSYSKTTFSQAGATSFSPNIDYGFDTRRWEARYNYKLSDVTTLYAFSAFEHTLETQTRRDDVTIRTRPFGLGLARTINERLVTQIAVGYTTMTFQGDRGGQDFSGPIVDANLNITIDDGTRLEFSAIRQPYASVFFSTNYYVDTELRARLTRQLGLSSYWDIGARVIDNAYAPAEGGSRHDGAIRLEGGVGHQFLRNLRGYFGGNFEYHQSNVAEKVGGTTVDPFGYRVFRLMFRLEVGWL